MEDFALIAVAIAVVVLLLSIVSQYSPQQEDRSIYGRPDTVNRLLAEKAYECFLEHGQGLDQKSDVCFERELDANILPTETDITQHLNCEEFPNSDCPGCERCVSNKVLKQDNLDVGIESRKSTVKISYSGTERKVSISSFGCNKDEDCEDGSSCTINKCVNPGTFDSYCEGKLDCSACISGQGQAGSDWCNACRLFSEGGFCSDSVDNDCDGTADAADSECSVLPGGRLPPNRMHIVFVPIHYTTNEFDKFREVAEKFTSKWLAVSPFSQCKNPQGHLEVEVLSPDQCTARCDWSACIGLQEPEPGGADACSKAAIDCAEKVRACASKGSARFRNTSFAVAFAKDATRIPPVESFVLGFYAPQVLKTVVSLSEYTRGGTTEETWDSNLQEFGHTLGVICHTSARSCSAPFGCFKAESDRLRKLEPASPVPGDIMDYCKGREKYTDEVMNFLITQPEALSYYMEGCI